MKRMYIAGLSLALTLVLAGGWAWADLEGSKHDFSDAAWSGGDRCVACHSPDQAEVPTTAPLWDPNADLTRRFGTSLGANKPVPGRGTTTCLRCHDGTIASDTVGGVAKDRFVNKRSPGLFRAGHDRTDHPVGVRYPQFDRDFRPLPSVVARGVVALPAGQVECNSCHDPHNMSGEKHMLVTSNARSALCLSCHKK